MVSTLPVATSASSFHELHIPLFPVFINPFIGSGPSEAHGFSLVRSSQKEVLGGDSDTTSYLRVQSLNGVVLRIIVFTALNFSQLLHQGTSTERSKSETARLAKVLI